jgi:uncharacterized protein YndB with AHSA1/START domain
MEKEPLVIERTYNAPVEKVWQAITNKESIKQWSFDVSDFKPEVGFEFRFYGGKDEDHQYLHVCEVTEVVVGKKLSYSWRYDGYKGISYVTFELFAQGEQTHLRFSHAGLETFPANNPDFARGNFVEGWNSILDTTFKEFVESSKHSEIQQTEAAK